MRLLTGSSPHVIANTIGNAAYRAHWGSLITPRDRQFPSHAVEMGVPWAIDNYAYTRFDPKGFISLLIRDARTPGCLFVAAPDVVGDAEATLRKFAVWQEIIRAYGYPVALVGQDGLERLAIPWDNLQAFFIGGTTRWKMGTEAATLAQEAKRRGKWVHMGRVNSDGRIRYAQHIGCDSCDGSGYARHIPKNKQAREALQSWQYALWEGFQW